MSKEREREEKDKEKESSLGPQGDAAPNYDKLSNPRVPKIMLEGGLCSTSERPITARPNVAAQNSARERQPREGPLEKE